MAGCTTHSRKSQVALLVSACEQRAAVQLAPRRRAIATCDAYLSAVERDGVLVHCDGRIAPEIETPGSPVQARFELDGRRYAFSSTSHGCVVRNLEHGENARLLKLSLPLTVQPARSRERTRLVLDESCEVFGVFTHVIDSRRQFRARLSNASDGGVSAVASTSELSHLHTGDLFWVGIEAPGEPVFGELVARLVHVRPVKRSDLLVMGWAFQPMEDTTRLDECLSRLEELARSVGQGD